MSDELYSRYLEALDYPTRPTLFLDLNFFEKNIEWVKKNAGGKKIRIATKSIRSKEILKRILESSTLFEGLMTYDLREALWLRREGFTNLLMGYPTMDDESLNELCRAPEEIILMVDREEHLEHLNKKAESFGTKLNVCVDIDLSMDLPGVRFGVFRSHLNSEKRFLDFIKKLKNSPSLNLVGLMGYEAQIAGVGDKNSPLIKALKSLSIKKLRERRERFILLLREHGLNPSIINGGGTGSLQTTREENFVTEVTVGSGFYSPGLFDHYESFTLSPSLAFTLPIVRIPEDDIITCAGGGYIASGEIGNSKAPKPYLPQGLELLKHEGAGEVQTPLKNKSLYKFSIGDSIIMRHAKAGEVCERFEKILLIKDNKSIGEVPTYRGDGKTFI